MDELLDAWRDLAARSRGRTDADAEDHLQDAVVAALAEHHRTGRLPETARAWLRTVAQRREADHVRRAQRERRYAAAARDPEHADDVAGEVLDRHEAHWLAARVETLPSRTRAVVHALAAGRSQRDVADQLGLTTRAVEAHVRRARLALRGALERAGALVPLLLGRRRWRRALPVASVGVAAALGLAMIGPPPGEDRLLPVPVPPIPRVQRTPDPDTPGPAYAVAGRAAPHPAATVVATGGVRPTTRPDPPRPSPTGSPAAPTATGPVLLVDSKGGPAVSQPTVEGAWYVVTVSGVYAYGSSGLADCGHYVPEEPPAWERQWLPYEALLVDGGAAPCFGMDFSPTNTYTWRTRGTGRPLRFEVRDFGGGGDNVGQLAISLHRSDEPVG